MSEISKKDLQNLGLGGYLQAEENIGFTDLNKTSAFSIKDARLDLENVGALHDRNPRLVIRQSIEESVSPSSEYNISQSWRQAVVSEHYLAKYQIKTKLVGQLSEIHVPSSFYSYESNNFFKPWIGTKIVDRIYGNGFEYARFRFPSESANTNDLSAQTKNGAKTITPKFAGVTNKEEKRKAYRKWHIDDTQTRAGKSLSNYDNGAVDLSGYNIPYPNSFIVYNGAQFNVPVKIAPKFNTNNSQALNGILVISTGTADYQEICYVSPHTIQTGYLNTIEDFYQEKVALKKVWLPGSDKMLTVKNSSWHGSEDKGFLPGMEWGYFDSLNGNYREASIPSQDSSRKRFYKLTNPERQIYFDSSIQTPYGTGTWVIGVSGSNYINVNDQNSGVVYQYEPVSKVDWAKDDPRDTIGKWRTAYENPNAVSEGDLAKADKSNPKVTKLSFRRKETIVRPQKIQVKSIIADSKYLNSGYVLPKGIYQTDYTYGIPAYPTWRTATTGTSSETQLPAPTGPQWSGYIIDGKPVNYQTILNSGIQIPQITVTGKKYTVDEDGYFKQTTPLKDTYFYKFYNKLYQNNKTISRGSWDGIIPSGVRFSVELISCTLDNNFGITNDENLAVIYSGYGTLDSIDKVLQTGISAYGAHKIFPNPSAKYMISGEVPWHQKRSPYRHAINDYNELVYTAFKTGPTQDDALNISRAAAAKTINSKILQLVNKIFPKLTYKNKKWNRMQIFKRKLEIFKNTDFTSVREYPSTRFGKPNGKPKVPPKRGPKRF